MTRLLDLGPSDRVVVRDQVGSLSRTRKKPHLTTSTGTIAVDDNDDARHAMPRERALRWLRELATPGSGTTADDLTRREVASMLRLSQRAMQLIIQRGTGDTDRIDGPEDFKDHDYMGAFEVGDQLVIADRSHIGETTALATPAQPGVWHAYIRHDPVHVDVSAAIFAVHEDHLTKATQDGEPLGSVAVDSGSVVVVDGRARKQAAMLKEDRAWAEGLIGELGCLGSTAHGEGTFDARAVLSEGLAVVVRASLDGPDLAFFHPRAVAKAPPTKKYTASVAKRMAAAGDAQDYSPKTKYAVGDRVMHPKFGDGVVNELLPDNKVSIDFPDGPRTLVHGR